MDLNDLNRFRSLDRQDMIGQIEGLPDQLQRAWQIGLDTGLPDWQGIQQVVVAGMGGSAIGADLLAAYAAPLSPVPVILYRNYGLPAWADGQKTLVIASSHSGDTEETLSSFQVAQQRGCRLLAVTTGGQLAQEARRMGAPLWLFEHRGQPRSAVGFSFGLLLAALHRLGLLPDPSADLDEAVKAMRLQQKDLALNVPIMKNAAKRLAGQLMDRWVVVIGSDFLAPVARRLKGQISEIAKAWGQFEVLPEADHNTLAGLLYPETIRDRMMVLFLQAPSSLPRNQLRSDLTRETFMVAGFNTDFVDGKGEGALANMWTALHFGDYMAYYLAMAYGVDPTPVEAIEGFKQAMSQD